MAIQLADTDEILQTFLGISSPTSVQQDQMDLIRTGIESSIKRFCRWQLTEQSKTSFMPLHPNAMGMNVPTAELFSPRYMVTGSRNRLQLPAMYVKSITSVNEDQNAQAGYGSADFGATTLLTAGENYFLEKDQGSAYSWSGGVIRVGRNWSSIPGTIKIVFVSGFSESELAGEQNALRLATIKECADAYIRLKRMQAAFVTGVDGGTLNYGLVTKEKLGDWEIGYADPINANSMKDDAGSYGLSQRLRDFLQDEGYVFCGVGV